MGIARRCEGRGNSGVGPGAWPGGGSFAMVTRPGQGAASIPY